MIQAVARQPELRSELQGIQWLGFALTEAVVFYGLIGGLLAYVLVEMPNVLASGLIEVVPGLMIWTLIAFGITFFVLKRYAFGPLQKTWSLTSVESASESPWKRPTTHARRPAPCSSSTAS